MYRFWETLKAYKGSIIFTTIGIVANVIGTLVYVSLSKTAQATVYVVKNVVIPAASSAAGTTVAKTVINAALEIPKLILWLSEHAFSFTVGAISFSIAAYQEYGEESAFPILAFWSYVLAMAMYVLHYAEETYKSAKRYIPFTGDSN